MFSVSAGGDRGRRDSSPRSPCSRAGVHLCVSTVELLRLFGKGEHVACFARADEMIAEIEHCLAEPNSEVQSLSGHGSSRGANTAGTAACGPLLTIGRETSRAPME
jgi:hypothetical protein